MTESDEHQLCSSKTIALCHLFSFAAQQRFAVLGESMSTMASQHDRKAQPGPLVAWLIFLPGLPHLPAMCLRRVGESLLLRALKPQIPADGMIDCSPRTACP